MSDIKQKRAERLIAFRKLQRDKASQEVHNAQAAKESAENAVRSQEDLIESEAERAQADRSPSSALDMQLSLALVDALRIDLQSKYQLLKNAEKNLGEKSKALLLTHQKVQQMEALKKSAKLAAEKETRQKEQAEIDDLANSREARH